MIKAAIREAFEKEHIVVLSQKEYKTILKELAEIRNSIAGKKEEKEPTKEEILAGITQGMKEAQLHRQGKLKLKSAKELLDEL